jgi:hypothetical protein
MALPGQGDIVAPLSSAARRRQAAWMLAKSVGSMISPDSFSCLLSLIDLNHRCNQHRIVDRSADADSVLGSQAAGQAQHLRTLNWEGLA